MVDRITDLRELGDAGVGKVDTRTQRAGGGPFATSNSDKKLHSAPWVLFRSYTSNKNSPRPSPPDGKPSWGSTRFRRGNEGSNVVEFMRRENGITRLGNAVWINRRGKGNFDED